MEPTRARRAGSRQGSRWWQAIPAVLLGGCVEAFSDRVPVDCETRERTRSDPSLETCARASSFRGCVPASAFRDGVDCLVLDADATFCKDDRVFDTEVFVAASGVELDCNGQRIEHSRDARRRSGIRTPYEYSVSEIQIRRCDIRNTRRYGIDLKRFFRGDELRGELRGHQRITVEDTKIYRSKRTGIYVGQESRDVVIDNVFIYQAHSGIYLEAGSRGTRVRRSYVADSRKRAGIMIDSSQDNVIEGSSFRGNPEGAIVLYKNCGERYGQVCPVRRTLSASHNVIRENAFFGDDVAIAARQFKTYALDWCVGIDVLGRWRDRATDNLIANNLFAEGASLDIQDSPNTAVDNRFEEATLEIGAGNPIGDGPIVFSCLIESNTFADKSWLAIEGSPHRVIEKSHFRYNTTGSGACYRKFRPRRACSTKQDACSEEAREIESAICE